MKRRDFFLAFRVPSYRLLWVSMFASANGFLPFRIGQGWLLLLLTDSPFMVGLAAGISGVSTMAASPFSGVLADRLDRRFTLMFAQFTMAAAIMALGIITVTDHVEVWHIMVISVVQGASRSLEGPARSTLMYDLVGREALVNAMAGRSMAIQSSSIVGPLAAGFIMAALGPGPLFIVISIVLFFGTLVLLPIQTQSQRPNTVNVSIWRDLKEGISFTFHDRLLRSVMWTVLITESLGFSSTAMLPIVTRDVLNAGPVVLGLLATFRGSGGMIGAFIVAGLGGIRQKGRLFTFGAFSFGALLVSFALSTNLSVSLALIVFVGAFGAIYDTLAGTLLQTLAPAEMRGRVMGFHSFILSGVSIGALGMGAVAGWLGVRWAIGIGGGIVSANAFGRTPHAKDIGERAASFS